MPITTEVLADAHHAASGRVGLTAGFVRVPEDLRDADELRVRGGLIYDADPGGVGNPSRAMQHGVVVTGSTRRRGKNVRPRAEAEAIEACRSKWVGVGRLEKEASLLLAVL